MIAAATTAGIAYSPLRSTVGILPMSVSDRATAHCSDGPNRSAGPTPNPKETALLVPITAKTLSPIASRTVIDPSNGWRYLLRQRD